MKITPIEIRKQEFKKAMRGYDSVEVDTFLEMVANEYDNLIQENSQLNKQVISLEAELKHFKENEKTLKQTLYNVQQTSQVSKENSEKAASLIKKEAELAAAKMIESARKEVHTMQEEITTLKQQKESLISRLRHLLSSQLELLEVLSIDDVDRAKLKEKGKRTMRKPFTEKQTPGRTPAVDEALHRIRKGTTEQNRAPLEDKKKPAVPEKHVKHTGDTNTGRDFFNDIFSEDTDVDGIKK